MKEVEGAVKMLRPSTASSRNSGGRAGAEGVRGDGVGGGGGGLHLPGLAGGPGEAMVADARARARLL